VATTTGSVRDPAPTTPARVSTAANPASTSRAPHPPPAHIALLVPPLTDREQSRCVPAADRDHALCRASRAYCQSRPPALPPTITMDGFTRAVVVATVLCDTRAPRRACAPPVLEQSTVMVQAEDMTGTTDPAGVGGSARVCRSRTHSSIR